MLVCRYLIMHLQKSWAQPSEDTTPLSDQLILKAYKSSAEALVYLEVLIEDFKCKSPTYSVTHMKKALDLAIWAASSKARVLSKLLLWLTVGWHYPLLITLSEVFSPAVEAAVDESKKGRL